MYRLTDDIARHRVFYPSPMVGTPHVLLIDIPPTARGPGLALDRYYVILTETEGEIAELEAFLAAPRAVPVRPDLLDHRPSAIRTDDILLIRYDPPASNWPWLSVCRWPRGTSQDEGALEMARGHYTFEAFAEQAVLERHCAELLTSLAWRCDLTIREISADRISAGGSA